MAYVARTVFMNWAPSSSTNSINILVAFRRMFGEINTWNENHTVLLAKVYLCGPAVYYLAAILILKDNTCTKHSTNISMPFIKSLLNNCVDKRRTMKEHSFVTLIVIFFGYFSPSMGILFPQFYVSYFLDFGYAVSGEYSP